ncbi:hypothetical protein CYY_010431, partial [Polysphondylium violaceum]
MTSNSNSHNNSSRLFFRIIKNKLLFRHIRGFLKYDDHVSFSLGYYDLPIGFFCRQGDMETFDKRWDKMFKEKNATVDHLFDVHVQDILDFFAHNQCWVRYRRVWERLSNVVTQIFMVERPMLAIELLSLCATKSDHRILKDLLTRLEDVNMESEASSLKALRMFLEAFCQTTTSAKVFDIGFNSFLFFNKNSTFEYCSLALEIAAKNGNMELCRHIFDKWIDGQYHNIKYPAGWLSSTLIKHILSRGVSDDQLVFGTIPPKNRQCIPFILKEYKYPNRVILDFSDAISFGDIDLLDFMLSIHNKSNRGKVYFSQHYKINSIAVLEYVLDKFSDAIDFNQCESFQSAIKHDLQLVQEFFNRGGKFIPVILDSPLPVVQFVLNNTEPRNLEFKEALIKNNYHNDAEIVRLLHSRYGDLSFSHNSLKSALLASDTSLKLIETLLGIVPFRNGSFGHLCQEKYPSLLKQRDTLNSMLT